MFLANIGSLIEPLTKDEWDDGSKKVPQGLFAHNTQQMLAQNVHAGSTSAQGMLGRIIDSITGTRYKEMEKPYRAGSYSLSGTVKALDGEVPADVLSPSGGNIDLQSDSELGELIANITKQVMLVGACGTLCSDLVSIICDDPTSL